MSDDRHGLPKVELSPVVRRGVRAARDEPALHAGADGFDAVRLRPPWWRVVLRRLKFWDAPREEKT